MIIIFHPLTAFKSSSLPFHLVAIITSKVSNHYKNIDKQKETTKRPMRSLRELYFQGIKMLVAIDFVIFPSPPQFR